MTPRPLWRWRLFCASLSIYSRARRGSRIESAAGALMAWCVLSAWLGHDDSPIPDVAPEEAPFP